MDSSGRVAGQTTTVPANCGRTPVSQRAVGKSRSGDQDRDTETETRMRRWIRLIARLYPTRWRHRYGAEFDALLEDETPTWRNAVDVAWGALEMHMNTWSFPKLAIVCATAGAILGAALAIHMPDKYVSEAVIRVSGDAQSSQFLRDRVAQRALSRNSLGELIQRNDLYATDRQRMPLDDVIKRMQDDIAITAAKSGTADSE